MQTAMRSIGKDIRVSTSDRRFYVYDGNVWALTPDTTVQQDLKLLAYEVLANLCKGLTAEINGCKRYSSSHDDLPEDLKHFKKARLYVQKAQNIRAITDSAKMMLWDQELADKLDSNPNFLGVKNGVIDLETGALRKGQPDDYISTILPLDYVPGPTDIPVAFLHDLFNGDQDTISYIQRLLGYAITGHTSEQIWTIWTGSGSNGKSLLLNTLEELFKPIWVTMPRECLFDSGRRQGEGVPTPHLVPLIGKRIGSREEKAPDAVLNEELIKTVTGQSCITARGCYDKGYQTFVATHLPILVCNSLPRVDVDDAAMLRRIVVVPFHNLYTTPDEAHRPYDSRNRTHRLQDFSLGAKLKTLEAQQQFLTWVVQGSVKWFDQGLGLSPPFYAKGSRVISERMTSSLPS